MNRKKGKNYVDPKEFYDEMVISLERGELTRKAIMFCQEIINRAAMCNHYDSKEELEDCKSYAMYNVLRYWKKFDPEKYDNPFSYFSSFAWTGLSQGWNILHPKKENGYTRISLNSIEDGGGD